jgi:hypothetical protein
MGAACPTAVLANLDVSKLPKDVWIYTGLFALALLVGAAIIAVFERWRKRQANETYTAHDQLTSFRLLYERGELSQQEYDRIKKQVMTKLKTGEAVTVVNSPEEPKDSPPPAAPPPPSEAGPTATGADSK